MVYGRDKGGLGCVWFGWGLWCVAGCQVCELYILAILTGIRKLDKYMKRNPTMHFTVASMLSTCPAAYFAAT